jgi:hypothetical protein
VEHRLGNQGGIRTAAETGLTCCAVNTALPGTKFTGFVVHKKHFLLVHLLQYTIAAEELQEESFGAVQPPQSADAASSPFQGQPMLPWLK